MNGKPFFDTNVLVYAFSEDESRSEAARMLLARGGVIGVQILNEFVAVARRKLGMNWPQVFEAVANIRVLCQSRLPLTIGTHERALRVAERHGYRIFDALVIAAALEASCSVLFSEDMHDGHVIEGLTIRNPFTRRPS